MGPMAPVRDMQTNMMPDLERESLERLHLELINLSVKLLTGTKAGRRTLDQPLLGWTNAHETNCKVAMAN